MAIRHIKKIQVIGDTIEVNGVAAAKILPSLWPSARDDFECFIEHTQAVLESHDDCWRRLTRFVDTPRHDMDEEEDRAND